MNWIWFVSHLPLCVICGGLGLHASRRVKPMWFWTGVDVREQELTDVRLYNRANARMWLAFALFYFVVGCVGLFQSDSVMIAALILLPLSLIALMVVYSSIYRRYRVPKR